MMIKIIVAVVFWGGIIAIPVTIAIIINNQFWSTCWASKSCTKVKGRRCHKHGRWYACSSHAGSPPSCPKCRQAEGLECQRAETERKRQETEREKQLFIAEFLEQGYSREAAEALAVRRQREKPMLEWQQREAEERARKEKEFAAGTGGTCPVCRLHVKTSDGIVLAHNSPQYSDLSEYHPNQFTGYSPCDSVGIHAWPPGVRYRNELPKDWPH